MSKKTIGVWAKNFRKFGIKHQQGCKNCILRLQRNILMGKLFFEKNWFGCLMMFGLRAKNFWACGKSLSPGSSELHSTCPEKPSQKNNVFRRNCKILAFPNIEQKFYRISMETFRKVNKTAFHVPRGTFEGKFSDGERFPIVFGLGAKKIFSDLEWKFFKLSANFFRQGGQNGIPRVLGNVLRKIIFRKKIFQPFWIISIFFLNFCPNIFGLFIINDIFVSRKIFWGRFCLENKFVFFKSSWDFERKTFCYCSQNCTPFFVRRKILC